MNSTGNSTPISHPSWRNSLKVPIFAAAAAFFFATASVDAGAQNATGRGPSGPAVLDAMVRAYPDRVSDPAIREGDWSVYVDDRLFLWAGGRLIPADEAEDAGNYRPFYFYAYPEEMPPAPVLDEQQVRELEERIALRETRQDARNYAFFTELWGMEDYQTAERTVESVDFLGWRPRVNPGIKEPLAEVEKEILRAAEEDPDVAEWLDGLASVGAYVWRDIAGSANRSFHSFGIAVDLTPADYGKRPAYWRWARDVYDEWWSVPQEERYPVPPAVVEAFESHGFAWGGKWFLYDRIHFEYRPELFFIPDEFAPRRRHGL